MAKIMKNLTTPTIYYQTYLETDLGSMLAIADSKTLYLLEFTDRRQLHRQIKRMQQTLKTSVLLGKTALIENIQNELQAYRLGQLKNFQTPVHGIGSHFQQTVWNALTTIPFGETRSYAQIAQMIGKPTSVRAVANAIGANPLAIIIPCHRVISSDGTLGGYAGGLKRKATLLAQESQQK